MAEEKKLNAGNAAEPKQPTYEELKNYCDQLMIQRNQLGQRLQQVTNVLNKLPWLLEVIKARDVFNKDFVERCVSEIEEIMTPPEEGDKEDNKD
jgi:dynactin complex subunit